MMMVMDFCSIYEETIRDVTSRPLTWKMKGKYLLVMNLNKNEWQFKKKHILKI